MFIRFFLLLVIAVVAAAMPGGWSNTDLTSPEVLEATNFAIDHKFSESHPGFKIIQARKQVVAGMNYDLVVEVTKPSGKCEVNHFQVYNRFGKLSLTEHDVLKEPCTHGRGV